MYYAPTTLLMPTSPLWITDVDVRRLLSVEEAIPQVEAALRQQAAGTATNMPRGHTIAGPVAGPGVMLAHMSAALHEQGVFGFKVYSIVVGEYRFFVLLYDMQSGDLLAVIEAASLGRMRTGAASGVSAMHMARENSAEIGILGSGFQADAQLEAICSVRPIERVRVFSRNPTNRSEFARRMTTRSASKCGRRTIPAMSWNARTFSLRLRTRLRPCSAVNGCVRERTSARSAARTSM